MSDHILLLTEDFAPNTGGASRHVGTLCRTLALHRGIRYEEVVIGHCITPHALGALALRDPYRVPYVMLPPGNDLSYSKAIRVDQLVTHLLLGASLTLGNSRFTANRIGQACYHGPLEVVNPGANPERFSPGVCAADVGAKYNLDGPRALLTVGWLVKRKNVEGVIRALAQLANLVPSLFNLVVGDGEKRKPPEALSGGRDLTVLCAS